MCTRVETVDFDLCLLTRNTICLFADVHFKFRRTTTLPRISRGPTCRLGFQLLSSPFLFGQVYLSELNGKQAQFIVHPRYKVKSEGDIVSICELEACQNFGTTRAGEECLREK